MRALSVRQPYAEQILRGVKTIEYRSRSTNIIGERFYLYAAGKPWPGAAARWRVKRADNIVVPQRPVPPWMLELANALRMFPEELPTGVIVGTAVIDHVTRGDGVYEWHLTDVERVKSLRKPTGHPQPVWFKPF